MKLGDPNALGDVLQGIKQRNGENAVMEDTSNAAQEIYQEISQLPKGTQMDQTIITGLMVDKMKKYPAANKEAVAKMAYDAAQFSFASQQNKNQQTSFNNRLVDRTEKKARDVIVQGQNDAKFNRDKGRWGIEDSQTDSLFAANLARANAGTESAKASTNLNLWNLLQEKKSVKDQEDIRSAIAKVKEIRKRGSSDRFESSLPDNIKSSVNEYFSMQSAANDEASDKRLKGYWDIEKVKADINKTNRGDGDNVRLSSSKINLVKARLEPVLNRYKGQTDNMGNKIAPEIVLEQMARQDDAPESVIADYEKFIKLSRQIDSFAKAGIGVGDNPISGGDDIDLSTFDTGGKTNPQPPAAPEKPVQMNPDSLGILTGSTQGVKPDNSMVANAMNSTNLLDLITQKGYWNRSDGTPKGSGFLGEIKNQDRTVSTELSIGVNLNGKETDIPILVPTLTEEEIKIVQSTKNPQDIPDFIIEKAVAHAKQRIENGQSPFNG